jgi:hypothetical protein
MKFLLSLYSCFVFALPILASDTPPASGPCTEEDSLPVSGVTPLDEGESDVEDTPTQPASPEATEMDALNHAAGAMPHPTSMCHLSATVLGQPTPGAEAEDSGEGGSPNPPEDDTLQNAFFDSAWPREEGSITAAEANPDPSDDDIMGESDDEGEAAPICDQDTCFARGCPNNDDMHDPYSRFFRVTQGKDVQTRALQLRLTYLARALDENAQHLGAAESLLRKPGGTFYPGLGGAELVMQVWQHTIIERRDLLNKHIRCRDRLEDVRLLDPPFPLEAYENGPCTGLSLPVDTLMNELSLDNCPPKLRPYMQQLTIRLECIADLDFDKLLPLPAEITLLFVKGERLCLTLRPQDFWHKQLQSLQQWAPRVKFFRCLVSANPAGGPPYELLDTSGLDHEAFRELMRSNTSALRNFLDTPLDPEATPEPRAVEETKTSTGAAEAPPSATPDVEMPAPEDRSRHLPAAAPTAAAEADPEQERLQECANVMADVIKNRLPRSTDGLHQRINSESEENASSDEA